MGGTPFNGVFFVRLNKSGAGRETGPPCCYARIRATGSASALNVVFMGFGTLRGRTCRSLDP